MSVIPARRRYPDKLQLSLHWIDIADMQRSCKSESHRDQDVGSISWAPNGKSFTFDRAGKIFIYDLASRRASAIADAKDPTWFPGGIHRLPNA